MHRTDTGITVGLRPDFSPCDLVFPTMSFGRSWIGPVPRAATSTRPTATDEPLPDYQHLLYWLAHALELLPARHDRLPWYLALPRQRSTMAALELYIRNRLFDGLFDPAADRWPVLLHPEVLARIARDFGRAVASLKTPDPVPRLQRNHALTLGRCIYTAAWNACERAIEHDVVRAPRTAATGAAMADFPAHTAAGVALKRDRPDLRRPRTTATWCTDTEPPTAPRRSGSHWYYAPLNEPDLAQWRRRARHLGDALATAQWPARRRIRLHDAA